MPIETDEMWWYSGPSTVASPEHVAPLTRSHDIQNMSSTTPYHVSVGNHEAANDYAENDDHGMDAEADDSNE